MTTLRLAEEPFLSIQGEGPYIGEPAVFLRLAGCNLRCSFCDTKYAWKDRVARDASLKQVVHRVHEVSRGCRRLVITGGEPLLQANALEELFDPTQEGLPMDWSLELETNGTLWCYHPLAFNQINVSPKLSNSLVPITERYKPDVLAGYVKCGATFKFVVGNEECVTEARDMAEGLRLGPEQVVLMPMATDTQTMITVMRNVYPAAMDWGVRLLPRLHILLGVK